MLEMVFQALVNRDEPITEPLSEELEGHDMSKLSSRID
jgi:hypothetical protein